MGVTGVVDNLSWEALGRELSFIDGVKKAIRDEREAYEFYGELQRYAPSRVIALRIRDIQMDEHHHQMLFRQMLEHEPDPWSADALHPDRRDSRFLRGVQLAYEDEVKAIAFYASLSLAAPDYATAARVRDIMRDEVTHAEFFAALLATLR